MVDTFRLVRGMGGRLFVRGFSSWPRHRSLASTSPPIIRSLAARGLVLGAILAFLSPAAADDAAGISPLPSVDPGKVSAAARQADVIVEVRIEGN